MTQAELAACARVGPQYVARLENAIGRRPNPTLSTIEALAIALECEVAELLEPPEPSRTDIPPKLRTLAALAFRLTDKQRRCIEALMKELVLRRRT